MTTEMQVMKKRHCSKKGDVARINKRKINRKTKNFGILIFYTVSQFTTKELNIRDNPL